MSCVNVVLLYPVIVQIPINTKSSSAFAVTSNGFMMSATNMAATPAPKKTSEKSTKAMLTIV